MCVQELITKNFENTEHERVVHVEGGGVGGELGPQGSHDWQAEALVLVELRVQVRVGRERLPPAQRVAHQTPVIGRQHVWLAAQRLLVCVPAEERVPRRRLIPAHLQVRNREMIAQATSIFNVIFNVNVPSSTWE